MANNILLWAFYGCVVRFWQLGIEMRPFIRGSSWTYPAYALGGGAFGYWLQGVEERQAAQLEKQKESLLAKRARKAQRDAERKVAAAELS